MRFTTTNRTGFGLLLACVVLACEVLASVVLASVVLVRAMARCGAGQLWAHGSADVGGARRLGARRCGARWCSRRFGVVYGTGERGLEGDGVLRVASAWGATRCGRKRSFDWRTIALGAMAVGAMPGGVTGGILQ